MPSQVEALASALVGEVYLSSAKALLVLLFPCQYVAFLLRPAAYLLVMASYS
jgi:hypothetical protein